MWSDLGLDKLPRKITSADAIFVDLMLMAGATRAWTLGDSSLDDLVVAHRRRNGLHKITNVESSGLGDVVQDILSEIV